MRTLSMQFNSRTSKLSTLATPCLVVAVYADNRSALLSDNTKIVDAASKGQISRLLKLENFKATVATTLLIHEPVGVKAKRILLVGLGKKQDLNNNVFQTAIAAATKQLSKNGIKSIDFALIEEACTPTETTHLARCLVEEVNKVLYTYDSTKSSKAEKSKLEKITLIVSKNQLRASNKGTMQGAAIADGMTLAKDLANLPGNICTPSYLAKQAKKLEQTHPIKTTILDEAQMKKKKMGSLLSVSRGSREPAKLIVMEYRGGNKNAAPVVLVGKGLTFDAGGISLKPAASMDEMKYDMCGGASVFGTMVAVAQMRLPINLIGVVPSSENLPDGAANKPGDIVTSMSGKTIEILNTDAEGRLILCDALTYAERFKPAAVIDIATLTGACVVALGHHACGLYSNDDDLADALLKAGESSHDRAWRMPMWKEYDKQLHSNFADLANIGGMPAGSVTAACFLSHFTQKYKWAHLDIAGIAWTSGAKKGATGRPVPLLVEYLLGLA